MKKFFLVILASAAALVGANAQVEFAYEAGAEVVSTYLWRGQYLGGLSFQPNATVGFESEHVNFQGGLWASLGASDWGFRKQPTVMGQPIEDGNYTYFVPEIDLTFTFDIHNVTIGLTHYYYCDGGNFFGWKSAKNWLNAAAQDGYESSSTTELTVGYNFADFLPEEHNLYLNWNTMIAGNDFKGMVISQDGVALERNYSSYLELGYDYTFSDWGLTLGAQMGMVPWTSDYYGNEGFAVSNLSLKANKSFEFDLFELDVFVQGMMNPSMLAADNESAFVKASGDSKIECQSLNGSIGVGIWF